MQQGASSDAGTPQPDVMLVEVAVVLVANSIDPAMINPDFLRYDGIVDRALPVTGQPISTPVFSQATFEGGITVTAEPNRFVFVQQAEPLREDACTVPEIARRFLNKVPHPLYNATGINAKAVRSLDGELVNGVADALVNGGQWMTFNEVLPVVGLKAVYSYDDRRFTLNIDGAKRKNSEGSESFGLLFQANVHRDIAGTSQQERLDRMQSILSGWIEDVSDFMFLVEKFNSRGEES